MSAPQGPVPGSTHRPDDRWDLAQYDRFRRERMEPFFDLYALVRPSEGMRILDLGCGAGELTEMLVERLPGASAVGLDSSEAMLDGARPRVARFPAGRLSFRRAAAESIDDYGAYDLIFSNAAFHWIPDNERLVRTILSTMRPGAQLAVQLPKNEHHASHTTAAALVGEEPFVSWLGGFVHRTEALALERYAELFHEHGIRQSVCIEKIYGHELARTGDVVEWVKGTALVPYLSRLDEGQKRAFLDAYRERLLALVGDRAPYYYTYRRMLLWAAREPH